MKRFALFVGAVIAVSAVAAVAMALDLSGKVPTNANELKNAGGSMALQTALNKEVDKANCTSFKGNTATANCDLKTLANKLAAASRTSKDAGNYSVYVKIEAGPGDAKKGKMDASDRANAVRDQLKSGLGGLADSWRYNTDTSKDTNRLSISVKVEK